VASSDQSSSRHHKRHHSSDQEASSDPKPSRRKARLADHLSPHEARLAKARAEHQARLARIEAKRHKSHHGAQYADLTPRERRHEERLAQIAKHNAHLAALHARHEAHLANLRAAHERRMAAIESRHSLHVAKYEKQHSALASGSVIRAAYAFQGTRYVMGGTSRSGFDCSGFTRYILGRSAGVDLPRTAIEQYYTGQPIGRDELRPGDLVFFRNTYKRGISHVGIYVGHGRFVHAANPHRGVTVDSLDEAYYQNHYAGARRVVHNRYADER
jgi:cell wall-associated NlpC family hydrolase